jgi:hypothetical protein
MTWNRVISGLIAVIYLALAYAHGGMEPVFKLGLFLILPLFCIWFSDAMGGYTGLTSYMISVSSSPGALVRILGWLLLFLPLIMGIIIYAEA